MGTSGERVDGSAGQTPVWRPPRTRRAIFAQPLPAQQHSPLNRLICRACMMLARNRILSVEGLEHVAPERDPFVLVLNHNQQAEAVLLPAALIYWRGGRLIHFLSDWNFRLIPVVATILRRSGTIVLVQKPARPRFLNVFRPLFQKGRTGLHRALDMLRAGHSVGVFPEGTVNPDPRRMLEGHRGAARISLSAGVPVVPAGIRFPGIDPARPIPPSAPFTVRIGPPMTPPAPARPGRPSPDEVRAWHHRIMLEIARLSGKRWEPGPGRKGSQ